MPRQDIRSRIAVSVNVRSQRDLEERAVLAMARSLTPIRLICYGTDGWAVRRSRWWVPADRKSTRLNSSHRTISYAVFCLKKKKKKQCSLYSCAQSYTEALSYRS